MKMVGYPIRKGDVLWFLYNGKQRHVTVETVKLGTLIGGAVVNTPILITGWDDTVPNGGGYRSFHVDKMIALE